MVKFRPRMRDIATLGWKNAGNQGMREPEADWSIIFLLLLAPAREIKDWERWRRIDIVATCRSFVECLNDTVEELA